MDAIWYWLISQNLKTIMSKLTQYWTKYQIMYKWIYVIELMEIKTLSHYWLIHDSDLNVNNILLNIAKWESTSKWLIYILYQFTRRVKTKKFFYDCKNTRYFFNDPILDKIKVGLVSELKNYHIKFFRFVSNMRYLPTKSCRIQRTPGT